MAIAFMRRAALWKGLPPPLAVIRITAEQMKELEELTRQYVAVCNGSNKELNPNDYADIDHKFHSLIVTASCNPYIMRMYRSLEGYLLHYRYCLYYSLDRRSCSGYFIRQESVTRLFSMPSRWALPISSGTRWREDVHSMLNAFNQWE